MSSASENLRQGQQHPAETLSQCLLSQYAGAYAGVGGGTAYTLMKRQKTLVYMVVGGAVGSLADLTYGYTVACAHLVNGNDDESR